ncbi:MAG: hypothetical protein ACOC22_04580 [bacterium]
MTTKKKRTKIPPETEAEVMFKSDLQCCICQEKGDHIHHLDSDPNNNNINNLALLCFKHHDQATITSSLSKKLSRKTILNYREHHYKVIAYSRQRQLNKFNRPVDKLTEEKLLIIAKNATIIIELEKIKEEYFSSNWDKRVDILDQLGKYINHSNHRLALDIFEFLSLIAGQTGSGGMTYNLGISVFGTVLDFFPSFYNEEKTTETIELAKKCIYIGYNIAYYSFIHLNNIAVATSGLLIIKFIYQSAKEYNITEVLEEVNRTYDELELTLQRPERSDLEDAEEMIKIFRTDLEKRNLTLPILTPNLMKRFEIEIKK